MKVRVEQEGKRDIGKGTLNHVMGERDKVKSHQCHNIL